MRFVAAFLSTLLFASTAWAADDVPPDPVADELTIAGATTFSIAYRVYAGLLIADGIVQIAGITLMTAGASHRHRRR